MLGCFVLACFKIGSSDFPGGLVVKILPASTGDMGLIPRKIPHSAGHRSPCIKTTELQSLEPKLCNKRSHRNEKPAHRNQRKPGCGVPKYSAVPKTKGNQKIYK